MEGKHDNVKYSSIPTEGSSREKIENEENPKELNTIEGEILEKLTIEGPIEENENNAVAGSLQEEIKNKKIPIENYVIDGKLNNISHYFTRNITRLKLSNCGLTDFPDEIPECDRVIEIDLSVNNLTDLPESFVCFKRLRVVDLSNNLLPKVPEAFFKGLYLVKTLNLSNNKLVIFRKSPCCLPKLHNLDLSLNRLVSPPQWLTEELPSSLIDLDLSQNPCFQLSLINKYDQSWKVSKMVQTLKLRNVGMRPGYSEKYLLHFISVTYLDVSNITVRELKNCIEGSHLPSSLTHLLIRNNGFAVLPKSILNLINLRFLDVSHNMFQWFPPTVKNLKNLVVLHAEHCGLFLLPPEMNELKSLKELYLASNQLSTIDGFDQINTIEVLDLYDNLFMFCPSLENFPRLYAFDYSYNYAALSKFVFLRERQCSYEVLKECFRSKFMDPKTTRLDSEKSFLTHPDKRMAHIREMIRLDDRNYVMMTPNVDSKKICQQSN